MFKNSSLNQVGGGGNETLYLMLTKQIPQDRVMPKENKEVSYNFCALTLYETGWAWNKGYTYDFYNSSVLYTDEKYIVRKLKLREIFPFLVENRNINLLLRRIDSYTEELNKFIETRIEAILLTKYQSTLEKNKENPKADADEVLNAELKPVLETIKNHFIIFGEAVLSIRHLSLILQYIVESASHSYLVFGSSDKDESPKILSSLHLEDLSRITSPLGPSSRPYLNSSQEMIKDPLYTKIENLVYGHEQAIKKVLYPNLYKKSKYLKYKQKYLELKKILSI